jgi:starvation-inducible DNA-binding protein
MTEAVKAKDRRTAGPSVARPNTGLGAGQRRQISDHLVEVLADTYTLLLKTHVYHWNIVGPLFFPLHVLLEEQYKTLFEASDIVAERIRALGHPTPLSFGEMLKRTGVKEETRPRSELEMVEHLARDHEQVVKRLRDAALVADEADDLVTTDMLTQRMAFHEKAIWMLRAIGTNDGRASH